MRVLNQIDIIATINFFDIYNKNQILHLKKKISTQILIFFQQSTYRFHSFGIKLNSAKYIKYNEQYLSNQYPEN